VVKLDAPRSRILAVGGNVRGAVSLKLLRAARAPGQYLRPVGGALFAHLKLRAEPIEQDALDRSPTMRALACDSGLQVIDRLAAANVAALADSPSRC
jgi:hypothetical protein